MKLVIKTVKKNYFVRLPNYFDVDKVQPLLEDIQIDLGEKIIDHQFYGDDFYTMEERAQLDLTGKITDKPVEITI